MYVCAGYRCCRLFDGWVKLEGGGRRRRRRDAEEERDSKAVAESVRVLPKKKKEAGWAPVRWGKAAVRTAASTAYGLGLCWCRPVRPLCGQPISTGERCFRRKRGTKVFSLGGRGKPCDVFGAGAEFAWLLVVLYVHTPEPRKRLTLRNSLAVQLYPRQTVS